MGSEKKRKEGKEDILVVMVSLRAWISSITVETAGTPKTEYTFIMKLFHFATFRGFVL